MHLAPPNPPLAVDVCSGEIRQPDGSLITGQPVIQQNILGVLRAVTRAEGPPLILVGPMEEITEALLAVGAVSKNLPEQVTMYDTRSDAFATCLQIARAKKLAGIVTRASTKDIVKQASYHLGRPEGIYPVYVTVWPQKDGKKCLLADTGSTLTLSPEKLLWTGKALQVLAAALSKESPTTFCFSNPPTSGLLCIATENRAGSRVNQAAAHLLSCNLPGFIGKIEANHILGDGLAPNLVLCHGNDGNIALKAAKGVIHLWRHEMNNASWARKPLIVLGAGLLACGLGRRRINHLTHEEYGGGILLGVGSKTGCTVTKVSSESSPTGFSTGIGFAGICHRAGVVTKVLSIPLSSAAFPILD
jgi:fatty acid/phospholipid biosynthesis enzyme